MTSLDNAAQTRTSELRIRVASAIVLIPAALAAALAGGLAFALLVAAVAVLSFWEWTHVTASSRPLWLRVVVAAVLAATLLAVSMQATDWAIPILAFPGLALIAAGAIWRTPLWHALGLLYVAVPGIGLLVLRDVEPHGWVAVLFVFAVVWATDVAAYFGGRSIGGPKLWPRISPKKTWSGAGAGVVGGTAAGVITAGLAGVGSPMAAAIFAALLSVAAEVGDLFESGIKRSFGVKDSGAIIPGHGGILDRVDGLFAAAALAWLIAAFGLGGELFSLSRQLVEISRGAG